MFKMVELLYVLLIIFQGYCLQYFWGNFLESRWKSRWNCLPVIVLYSAGLYGISNISFNQNMPMDKTSLLKLALSLCMLFALVMCFYKAFRPVTVFLVAAFQAVADISRYALIILFAKMGDGVIDVWNRCVESGVFRSDKALTVSLGGSILVVQVFQYLAMALLLYISLKIGRAHV